MAKNLSKSWLLALAALFICFNVSAQNVRQTSLFNSDWKFYKGDVQGANDPSYNDQAWRSLDLPHDWSIEGPFSDQWASATAYLPAGIGWYRKSFDLTVSQRSKNIYIYFDGVYNNSEVWINGHYLGKRPNGFIPFQYELTPYLNKTGKNIIAVKADHTKFGDSRWYTGSGIYRNVYLVAKSPISIDLWGIAFSTPEVSKARANAKVAVSFSNNAASKAPVLVKSTLYNAQGKAVASSQQTVQAGAGAKLQQELFLGINNPVLWSDTAPNLYKLEVALYQGGKKIDDVSQSVGIRSFKFDAEKGFSLNGKAMKLKGVCIHDDAGALGVAVPEEVWERRLKTLKEAGCNSIRLSHNPHADYMYNLCDRLGFLVMDEAFDEWELGKNKWIKGWNVGTPGQDGYHEYFAQWGERDLGDMVLANRNHPSIIMWSIGNEIDYPNDPYTHPILNTGNNPQIYGKGYTEGHPPASELTRIASKLVAAVKKIDTTRPVTAALAGVVMSNEAGYPEVLDIVGYNYQEFRYPDDHKKYPARIIYGSENGHGLPQWNAVADNEFISAQYLWTGIDYLGEARQWPSRSNGAGLLDLAGFKKNQFYFRQSLWSDKPMVFIGTSLLAAETGARGNRNSAPTWNFKSGDKTRVSCFSNCPEVELFLNGKSMGKKTQADAKDRVISWDIDYEPGTLLVKGYKSGKQAASYTLKTAGPAYAIQAKTDRASFSSGSKQLAHIELTIVDKNGIPVYDAENEITLNVSGPAAILGLESGSLVSHEDYKANKHKVLHGNLLAYVQSQQKAGAVKIVISAEGLQGKVIDLAVRP